MPSVHLSSHAATPHAPIRRPRHPGWVLRLAGFSAALLMGQAAHAWGAEGHRLIAELAQERLSPEARAKVQALLDEEPGATLSSIATWADEVRTPSTAAWHYVNFDRELGCRYEAARNCPDGHCVVGAIERQLQVLQSNLPSDQRLKALKWVVHLVGDAHQPLHAGLAGDKGGNLYQVQAYGRGGNLHSLWDGGLIRNWSGGAAAWAQAVRDAKPRAMSPSPPKAWAEESCEIVLSADFYPEGHILSEAYPARWSGVLAERLSAAAIRLAQSLEQALR
jgi:nuclease S1